MEYIDLRSDTVTKPSEAMRRAMMDAEVGDDVYGEDPTVNKLQNKIASMFEKDAALFVPSGTMGNEICIQLHTQPGDEIIVEEDSHIFVYETAAPSLLAGVQMLPLRGDNGVITAEQIKKAIRPAVYYLPPTKLICIENTHGRSAGSVIPIDEIKKVYDVAAEQNIKMHLDGARLWNASVASKIHVRDYAKYFDSISVCFSKALGAPIGSMIIGSHQVIEKARRYRKIFGGGMRQVGILAAAAMYAVENNIDRLSIDHENAKMFSKELSKIQKLKITPENIQTNMVIVDISETGKTQSQVLKLLKEKGILLTPERDSSVRAVMHLDVDKNQVMEAAKIFQSIFDPS
ncbi:MAG: low-specificity L-threonine aldolase [Ignavibacteriales bacterium]|nr:low-specificity L-threonine aldolase [Ignavibacteriales bacterium]